MRLLSIQCDLTIHDNHGHEVEHGRGMTDVAHAAPSMRT